MAEPTPVADDWNATVPELLARAAADFDHTNTVAQAHAAQGGTGQREGVLPGSSS
jgi:hypothetical protein